MTAAISLTEVVGGVVAALHPEAAARCNVAALLSTLEQHCIFSYEDLGDALCGEAAKPLRAALLASAPLVFLSKLVHLYYNGYRGIPRDLPDEEQAKADDNWWKAHDNTISVIAALRQQTFMEQPRLLRSSARAIANPSHSPSKRSRKSPEPPPTEEGKRQRSR